MSKINSEFYPNLFKETSSYYKDNYYIHYHQNHIGLAYSPNNIESNSSIANTYSKFIQQKNLNGDSIISEAIKTQYISLLAGKIKSDEDRVAFLADLDRHGGINAYSDQIIEDINAAIEGVFPQKVIAATIMALNKNAQSANWNWGFDKNSPLSEQDLTKCFKGLDSLFSVVLEGLNILKQASGDPDGVLENFYSFLNTQRLGMTNFTSLSSFGKAFSSNLNSLKTNTKITSVRAVNVLIDELLNVANALERMSTESGKDLTLKLLKSIFDSGVFPVGLGETAAGLSFIIGQNALSTNMNEVFKNGSRNTVHYTGKKLGRQGFSSALGIVYENNLINQEANIKTDVEFQNFKVHTRGSSQTRELSFEMDLGLSAKTYASKKMGNFGDKNFGNQQVSLGGGMDLGTAVNIISNDDRIRYLGYNAIAWRDKGYKEAYQQIKKAAFLRSIIYLTGSRNFDDFASLLMVNGQIISLWDIIKYVILNIDTIMGSSGSRSYNGVTFKINENIPDSKAPSDDQEDTGDLVAINKRITKIYSGMHLMTMSARLKPRAVLEAMGKRMITYQ